MAGADRPSRSGRRGHFTPASAPCSACAACRSSTSPAAISRSRTRTRRSGSSATARSTTSGSCAPTWSAPAIASAPAATSKCIAAPVRGARRSLRRPRLAACSRVALWDAKRERLILARDRLGIKPLYYAAGRRQLAFASEVKALLDVPSIRAGLDRAGLRDYLGLGYASPRTRFSPASTSCRRPRADLDALRRAHRVLLVAAEQTDERSQATTGRA